MTDFRALCAELADELTQFNAWYIEDNGYGLLNLEALLRRCDAALAEPKPEGPTDKELRDLWSWAAGQDQGPWPTQQHCFARAVLARWGRPTPQPVPVSERLPRPEDCDAEGKCWWGRSESNDWSADWTLATHEAVAEFCEFSPQTMWLPAHALPLPDTND